MKTPATQGELHTPAVNRAAFTHSLRQCWTVSSDQANRLHLHVADANAPVGAEGQPHLLAGARVVEAYRSIAAFEPGGLCRPVSGQETDQRCRCPMQWPCSSSRRFRERRVSPAWRATLIRLPLPRLHGGRPRDFPSMAERILDPGYAPAMLVRHRPDLPGTRVERAPRRSVWVVRARDQSHGRAADRLETDIGVSRRKGRAAVRAFVATTRPIFALILAAHVARLLMEGTGSMVDPVFIASPLAFLALVVWAAVLLRRT